MNITVNDLEKLIDYHDSQYWIKNDPKIKDEEYDKLLIQLSELDPSNSRLNRLHSAVNSKNKVKHINPMLSLDKVYNNTDLFKWIDKNARFANEPYLLQPKLDGLSADRNGQILSTRGDGQYGENLSNKIPIITVESCDYTGPMINDPKPNRRGEIIIKKDTYEKYKDKVLKDDGTIYKTPRGMCSGLLNRDDVDLSLTGILIFVDFGNFSILYTATQLKTLDWFKLLSDLKTWEYPTDGLVIKLDDVEYSNSLGSTSHHPRGQIAYKASNPSGTAKLLNVIWSSGKGKLTPVGLISPVIIAGAEIKKVSLHNAKNIISRDIKINDELTIERAGEIIPYVVDVIPAPLIERKNIIINCCPDCGTTVVYNEPDIRCPNNDCNGKLSRKLTDSVVRLGFEFLAGATIEKLIDIGVENLIDILDLQLNDIQQLDGFADKSSIKLFDEIQRIKSIELEDWRFVSALNIKGIGRGVSRKILDAISLSELETASIDQLILIDSIGIERAIEITEFFDNNKEFINELKSRLDIIHKSNSQSKTICFTGKADQPRNELYKIAESKGYIPINSVTTELTILVTDDLNGNKNKMKKAKSINSIKIMTYEQFYEL